MTSRKLRPRALYVSLEAAPGLSGKECCDQSEMPALGTDKEDVASVSDICRP